MGKHITQKDHRPQLLSQTDGMHRCLLGCLFICILLLIEVPCVLADTYHIAGMQVAFQAPEKFVEASSQYPEVAAFARSNLPASIKMLALYVDTTKVRKAPSPSDPIPYYLTLATSSSERAFSSADMARLVSDVRSKGVKVGTNRLLQLKNEQKKFFDVDNFEVAQPLLVRTSVPNENSLTRLMLLKVSESVGSKKRAYFNIMSFSMARVKNRLLLLYLVKKMESDADIDLVENTMNGLLQNMFALNR